MDTLARGTADLVAFGKAYMANPDLVLRFKLDALLNVANSQTYYDGGVEGYTDYPVLAKAAE